MYYYFNLKVILKCLSTTIYTWKDVSVLTWCPRPTPLWRKAASAVFSWHHRASSCCRHTQQHEAPPETSLFPSLLCFYLCCIPAWNTLFHFTCPSRLGSSAIHFKKPPGPPCLQSDLDIPPQIFPGRHIWSKEEQGACCIAMGKRWLQWSDLCWTEKEMMD